MNWLVFFGVLLGLPLFCIAMHYSFVRAIVWFINRSDETHAKLFAALYAGLAALALLGMAAIAGMEFA